VFAEIPGTTHMAGRAVCLKSEIHEIHSPTTKST